MTIMQLLILIAATLTLYNFASLFLGCFITPRKNNYEKAAVVAGFNVIVGCVAALFLAGAALWLMFQ